MSNELQKTPLLRIYIFADEIVALVHHSPGGDTNADDVVASLREGVTQRFADMVHNTCRERD